MVAIVERSERVHEIFDGRGRLLLVAQTTTDLHTIPTFVDVKKAPHSHISFGILGEDLQAKLKGMFRLEWGQLHGAQINKNVGPY
jgi:hypothetical protein